MSRENPGIAKSYCVKLQKIKLICVHITIGGNRIHKQYVVSINKDFNCQSLTNKCQRNPHGQSQMDNPEKRAAQGTPDEEKQYKNTTQYVLDTTVRKQR